MADKEQEFFVREVVEGLVLGRGDKRIKLTTGMKFPFTQEELDEIKKSAPNSISNKMVVDMDGGDADPSLREVVQTINQTAQPDGKGTQDKAETASQKKAREKAEKAEKANKTNADDEL